jgi:hypothetical protein
VWSYIKSKADSIYQATLVSGTSIKTINSTSLLGSGNISVTADLTAPGPIGGTTPSTVAATSVTVTGGTVTASTPVVNVTQTWNASGVAFVGKKTNITNTASAGGSMIESWQLNSGDRMTLSTNGTLTISNAIEFNHGMTGYGIAYGNGISGNGLAASNGTKSWLLGLAGSFGMELSTGGMVAWQNNAYISNAGARDAGIGRNAAGVVEVNSGTSGTFRDLKLRNHIGTGGNVTGMAAKTADYTLTLNDHAATFDATAAARTATLPALSTVTAGQEYIVIKIDSSANALTLDGNASETINGAANISTTTQWAALRVKANAGKSAWVTF